MLFVKNCVEDRIVHVGINSEQQFTFKSNLFSFFIYSDLSRCQQIVSDVGPQILLEHDERGHTAMHWACLAGDNDIVRFFIQCSAPLDKGSNNDLGPKPIHWASVNGHILTIDLLLQHGVSINTTDNRGCTPLIIATQYGKTMLVSYLIGKGARKDFTDIDGDTALHWAAFKGKIHLICAV